MLERLVVTDQIKKLEKWKKKHDINLMIDNIPLNIKRSFIESIILLIGTYSKLTPYLLLWYVLSTSNNLI